MKKFLYISSLVIAFFFVLLFIYAGASKLLVFEDFKVDIGQSPLISAYAGWISYAVIGVEFVIALLLCFERTRLAGLYLSLGIMVSFTVYIYLILNHSEFVPCSCGGILGELGWTEHLIFNIVCVLMALGGIAILESRRKTAWKRTSIQAGTISLVSALVVVLLFVTSEHIIKKENNFTRRFLQHPTIKDKTFDLGLNSYYFAGADSGRIYLGNYTAPLNVTSIDTALKDTSKMRIRLDKSDYGFRNLQLQIKAPYYYLYDGSVPIIYRGNVGNPKASTVSYADAYFTQMFAMDSSRFAFIAQSRESQEYILADLDMKREPRVKLYPSVLEKQIDGVFDVSGRLIKNQSTDELIYTYTYRNQFITIDSNLNVIKRLNTIDTTTRAKIAVVKLSDGSNRMSAPPLKINKNMVANRNVLFIQSTLMGRNESVKMWKKASIVDMYRTDNQEYIGSFYVPNRREETIRALLPTDRYLYVLIGNEVIRYRLRNSITRHFK